MAYPPISTLPSPPSRQDPANFAAEADAFLGALPTFQSQVNAAGTYIDGIGTAVDADAIAAAASATSAAASASAASQVASVWVSGASYTIGNVRFSPITYSTYRAKTNHSGVTTDPSLDATNWVNISGFSALTDFGVTASAAELNQLDTNTFTADITIPDKIIHAGDTDTAIRFPAANTVTVETAGAERLRVDSSGNVLVGTTDTSMGGLKGIRVGSGSATGAALVLADVGTANKGFFYSSSAGITWETVSGAVAEVLSGGTGGVSLSNGATSWSAVSDERLKTTVAPFEGAVQKVCSLRAGTGRYLTDEEDVSRSFLIAQDVQAVLPEAVDVQGNEQGTLGLRYTDVVPLLVAAIKELKAEVDSLKAQLEAAQ